MKCTIKEFRRNWRRLSFLSGRSATVQAVGCMKCTDKRNWCISCTLQIAHRSLPFIDTRNPHN